MPTGEHALDNMPAQPTPAIGTSTPITIALMIAVSGAIFMAGGAMWRLGAVEKAQSDQQAKLEATAEADAKTLQAHELRIQRGEDRYEVVVSKLDTITAAQATLGAKFDRLNDHLGGVRPARGVSPP